MRRRFTLFGFGFALGIILLLFFLNGKNASCNFFPNERILDILRNKHKVYSEEVQQLMLNKNIDTASIESILLNGDVDFSKSNVRQEPCRDYWIDGYLDKNEASLFIQNCDTVITIQHIYFNK